MKNQHRYSSNDKMSSLICDNYSLLTVVRRFGLALGFGDATIGEVCSKNAIDTATFLTVVNFIAEERDSIEIEGNLSVEALMTYLKNAHSYFLGFKLPAIREKLVKALSDSKDTSLSALVMKFYDEYVAEVFEHMDYEDKHVFTYVSGLLSGSAINDKRFTIGHFAKRHDRAESKLTELKNIMIKYYPYGDGNAELMNDVLCDIYNCEADLALHTKIEDYLFIPAIAGLEKNMMNESRQQ